MPFSRMFKKMLFNGHFVNNIFKKSMNTFNLNKKDAFIQVPEQENNYHRSVLSSSVSQACPLPSGVGQICLGALASGVVQQSIGVKVWSLGRDAGSEWEAAVTGNQFPRMFSPSLCRPSWSANSSTLAPEGTGRYCSRLKAGFGLFCFLSEGLDYWAWLALRKKQHNLVKRK